MHLRYPAVQGSFYPDSTAECGIMIAGFQKNVPERKNIKPIGMVVPHAGWIYSGQTAIFAYDYLRTFSGKRIVILAPSHHAGFTGLSVGDYDAYLIHNREIAVDRDYLTELRDHYDLEFYEQAHRYEHSDEVQLPFLEHYLKDYKIVSLLYSYENYESIVPLLKHILSDSDNLLLISSDLSHYHPQQQAVKTDQHILTGVLNYDLPEINRGEACGRTGIMAMVKAACELSLSVEQLDYRTSGDVSGDFSKVVGYASFVFY